MTLTIFSPKTSPRRAAEDGEVLGEHADRAAVDGAVAGDDAVAVRPVLAPGRSWSTGAGPARRVSTKEPSSSSMLDPLAGGLLALGVLLLDRPRRARVDRLVVAPLAGRRACPAVVWMSIRRPRSACGAAAVGCSARHGHAAWAAVALCACAATAGRSQAAAATAVARAARAAAWRSELDGHGRRSSSTNLDEAARPAEDPAEGVVLSPTTRARAGAGLARPWTAPPRTRGWPSRSARSRGWPAARWAWLPLLTGLAVGARRWSRSPGLPARLKWPNDVLVDGASSAACCPSWSRRPRGRPSRPAARPAARPARPSRRRPWWSPVRAPTSTSRARSCRWTPPPRCGCAG